jgi:hypothetical protein
MQAKTSVTPRNIFTPQQTAYNTNQGVANAFTQSDPYSLSKEMDRPGMSRSAATQRNLLPAQMQGRVQAAQAQAELPFADAAANANNMLRGQVAREGEALGWSDIGSSLNQNAMSRQLVNNQQAISLLSTLLGI